MRILQCSDAYYPFPGGVTEHMHHLSVALRRRGHTVHILTAGYQDAPEHEEDIFRVGKIRIVKGNLTQLTITPITPDVAKRVKKIVRSGYDIVHTHGPYAPNLPFLAARASLSGTLATHHTDFAGFNWHRLGRFVFRNVAKRVHLNICVSKVALNAIQPWFPGLRYVIIPNGVDTHRFRPDVPEIPELKAISGPKILYVGRMEDRKGFPHLLEAFKLVKKALPDAVLVACGKGPNLEMYKASVPKELRKSVLFVGFVPTEQLASYYAGADVYTSPAVGGETFGIVLIEAMASGTPVVANALDGYAQVINHGQNGLLVDVHDPQAYAQALIRVLEDRALRDKLVEAGLASADGYSWDRVASQVERAYEMALDLKNQPVS